MFDLRTFIVMESIKVVIDDGLVHTNNALDEDCDSDSAPFGEMMKEKPEKGEEMVTHVDKVRNNRGISL